MKTLGWILVLYGAFIARQASKGRSLVEVPQDIADAMRFLITGDWNGIDEVLSRGGDATTPLDRYKPKSGFVSDASAGSGAGGGGGGGWGGSGGSGGWVNPVSGRITSRYGLRNGRLHAGTDIAASTGTPVRAAGGGTVVYAGKAGKGITSGRTGNAVVVRHGVDATYYGHLSTIAVKVGDKVTAGQSIGAVGSTGNSTGPHLHFEYRPVAASGAAVDAVPVFRLRGVKIGG